MCALIRHDFFKSGGEESKSVTVGGLQLVWCARLVSRALLSRVESRGLGLADVHFGHAALFLGFLSAWSSCLLGACR